MVDRAKKFESHHDWIELKNITFNLGWKFKTHLVAFEMKELQIYFLDS